MSRSRSAQVVVGWHDSGNVDGKFAYCLARAIAFEGGRVKSCVRWPGPYVDESRNKIVETFLALPEPEYLMMMDADIDFERDAISKTMTIADGTDADVVWGNYALGTFSNSLFIKDPGGTDYASPIEHLEAGKVYEDIYAGGTGWCLMRRSLLERMKKECQGPWFWFDRDVVTDEKGKATKMGEDLSFGRRVHQIGGKQVGYTGIFLVHNKKHPTAPQFMGSIAEELGITMNNQSIQP